MADATDIKTPSPSQPINGIMAGMSINGDIHSDTDIIIRGTLNGNLT